MDQHPKKIIFDTRWIGDHGIGRFAKEVYDNNFFTPIKLNGNPVSVFDVLKLTLYLMFHKNFYFSPGFNAPFFFLNRTAITIHDLNHIDVDANTSFLKKIYYKIILKRACKKSAMILTVSEFSKKRIVEWSGVDPSKIKVVYNGISNAFHRNIKPYNIASPYILVVGNRKLHKNENRALYAFAKAKIPNDIKIIFSGNPSEQLIDTINNLNIKNRVVFSGRLSEQELASMYKGAKCLLFPSLYEGFGLPAIEAMACGTPVITSDTTSLPEICSDKVLYVNPKNTNDIAQKIEFIFQNDDICKNLAEEGLIYVNKFNWKNTKILVEQLLTQKMDCL